MSYALRTYHKNLGHLGNASGLLTAINHVQKSGKYPLLSEFFDKGGKDMTMTIPLVIECSQAFDGSTGDANEVLGNLLKGMKKSHVGDYVVIVEEGLVEE